MSAEDSWLTRIPDVVHRQARLIMLVTGSAVVVATITLVLFNSQYSATALLHIGVLNGEASPASSVAISTDTKNAIMESEIAVLRSDAILVGLIEDLGLLPALDWSARDDPASRTIWPLDSSTEHALAGSAMLQPLLREIRANTRIERVGSTFVIAITASDPDPAQAARIANGIASYHMATRSDLVPTPVSLVSPAQIPDRRNAENSWPIVGLFALGGLLVGVSIALVRDTATGRIANDRQLSSVTQTPVLGTVPRLKMPPDMQSPSQFVFLSPLSGYSEAVRQIRAGIDRNAASEAAQADHRGLVIMISSPLTREGKTSIALSLARTYAAAGKKTLIVDCDLRCPSIHRHLGIEPSIGLIDYLSGEYDSRSLAALIVFDSETGLGVVVGSRRSEIPTDQFLLGPAFERLITAAAANFDVIVLDSPPILPVVDGRYLARYADVIIAVVKGSSTTEFDVRSTISRLEEAQRPDARLYTVLNQYSALTGRLGGTQQRYHRG